MRVTRVTLSHQPLFLLPLCIRAYISLVRNPRTADAHTRISKISALKYDSPGEGRELLQEISHRTLNLFLFILRGYKMVAKRFSPAPDEWKAREREGRKKKQHRGKELRTRRKRKRKGGADDDGREKGSRQQVRQRVPGSTFVFRRTVFSLPPLSLSLFAPASTK